MDATKQQGSSDEDGEGRAARATIWEKPSRRRRRRADKAFDAMDTNNDGVISREEFRAAAATAAARRS